MNRTALITGASRGIGRACAFVMADAGYRVVLAARNVGKLEDAAAAIRAKGQEAFVAALDLASLDSIRDAIAAASKEFGRIDVLVNNAGITKDGLAVRMKPQDWQSVIDTNLSGSFYAIQQVVPGMMKERWGRIINITSVVGESGNPGQANYVASKAGLIGLTKSLAQELASRNITVNAVAPGFVDTEMTQVLSADLKTKMLEHIPLKRLGCGEDIAHAVCFLASDQAAYITGHVLDVNGGMFMR